MSSVTIYTAPQCPHSKKLKEFLQSNGVDFEEKCVLTDPATIDDLRKVSNQLAIPVLVKGEEVFTGFGRRAERRIKRALGV